MKTSICFALALSLVASALYSQAAWAGSMTGNGALSFAALVGQDSPHLTHAEKSLLLDYLNSRPKAKAHGIKEIVVTADSVTCRISDVDITYKSCDLKFGAKTVSFTGRKAQEFYATLAENGVPGDGAAGSIYEAVGKLDCKIKPSEVAGEGGGGANCDYAPAK